VNEKKENKLPPLSKGENVKVTCVRSEKRFTKPPSRFTEGVLLKKMERLGLGTPATRASIIETLKKRKYVICKGKSLQPTWKGLELIKKCQGLPITSVELTSDWERKLEMIYKQDQKYRGYKDFMKGIESFVRELTEKVKQMQFKPSPSTDWKAKKKAKKTKFRRH
jgi:DNA topoisomerase IA